MAMEIKPATTIEEAIALCAPDEPLPAGDPRWQDFSQVRGIALAQKLNRRLESYTAAGRYICVALSGHRGCGKSTELYRVKHRAEQLGYLVLYTRVDEELDPYDVDYSDLLLLISRMVEEAFRREGMPLDPKLLEHISRWFMEVTKIEETQVEASLGVRGELEAKAELPFFAKLMVALTSSIQAGGKSKTEIRETVQRYPKALVDNVNLLMDDAYKALKQRGKKGLLLIFDNLDRYRPEIADRLLLQSADILKGVHCHAIYTVPISLIYDPLGDRVRERFLPEILPMIAVRHRDGSPNEEGIGCLMTALSKRLDVESIFESEELARRLILMSGGCIRDLMYLIQEACLVASERIDEEAVERSIRWVRADLSRGIQAHYYPLLAGISITKSVPGDEDHRKILFHRYALEYEGERWADVHPLIEGLKEFQDALAEERKKRGIEVG